METGTSEELDIPEELLELAQQRIFGTIDLVAPCSPQSPGDIEIFAVARELVEAPDEKWVFELTLTSVNQKNNQEVCKVNLLSFLTPGSANDPIKLTGYHKDAVPGTYKLAANLTARKLLGGPTIPLSVKECQYTVS